MWTTKTITSGGDWVDTLNYKCPNCSAGLTFDSKEQKMKCEFCGSTYSLEELDKLGQGVK